VVLLVLLVDVVGLVDEVLVLVVDVEVRLEVDVVELEVVELEVVEGVEPVLVEVATIDGSVVIVRVVG
jgi:hypothetical protein